MTWYQNAVVGGVAMPAQRRHDTSARRWQELINPLLPPGEGRLLVDLGCNAGYYCREAVGQGYRAIGVERDETWLAQARWWEQEEPRGVRVVSADIREYPIPACHVALLVNVHYWLTPTEVAALVARLRRSALRVLVVGRRRGEAGHASPADRASARAIFNGWKVERRTVTGKHYGLLFRNPRLIERDTAALFALQPFVHSHQFLASFREYIDLVLAGEPLDFERTLFADYQTRRRFNRGIGIQSRYRQMILETQQNGTVTPPLSLRRNGSLQDGDHRLIVAERLGIERVLCHRIRS